MDVDVDVALRWGELRAAAGRSGRTLPVADALIAATASAYSFIVVTRNVRDFAGIVPDVVDPGLIRSP